MTNLEFLAQIPRDHLDVVFNHLIPKLKLAFGDSSVRLTAYRVAGVTCSDEMGTLTVVVDAEIDIQEFVAKTQVIFQELEAEAIESDEEVAIVLESDLTNLLTANRIEIIWE